MERNKVCGFELRYRKRPLRMRLGDLKEAVVESGVYAAQCVGLGLLGGAFLFGFGWALVEGLRALCVSRGWL